MRIIPPLPRLVPALAALLALAACADSPETGPTGPSRAEGVTADTVPAPDTLVYEGEAEYEAIQREVPAYAGHWRDSQGNRVVALTDESQKDAALKAIELRREPDPAEGEPRTSTTIFIPARYTFAQLRDYRNAATFPVLEAKGAVLVDLDEERNRVFVGISDASARPDVEARLARAGVPLGAVIIEETGTPEAYQTLQNFFRPLQSGYQIRNAAGAICTLGVPAVGVGASYITNSHCTQAYWWNTGTNFFQHTIGGAFFIGAEILDPAGWPCGGSLCRWSDAARIPVAAGVPAAVQVARTTGFGVHWNPGSITTGGVAAFNAGVAPQWWPLLGQVVDKVGRTTGWTRGVVTHTCVNFVAPPPAPPGRVVLCQYLMTNMAGPGDSGSPVFRVLPGNNAQITGLLWGGIVTPTFKRSIFSPRGGVFADLGS